MYLALRVMKILPRALVESFRTAMCPLAFFLVKSRVETSKTLVLFPSKNGRVDILSKKIKLWIFQRQWFKSNFPDGFLFCSFFFEGGDLE